MSLPWNSGVRLRLEPQRVAGALEHGFIRKRIVASASAAGAGDPAAAPIDATAIESVLRRLELVAPLRGADLRIELGSPFVHFDVTEGDFGRCSERQLQTIAAACAGELLGAAVDGHEVRWSLQRDDRHLFICAVPHALILALEEVAQPRHMKLASVQTRFALQWNRCAPAIQADTAVFAVTCGAQAVVACAVRRAICAISIGAWRDAMPTGHAKATGTTRLDARVRSLLASLGLADADATGYVLVTPDAIAGPTRWNLVQVAA